jgi:uncharacterized FlaG/YvyC family protein
MSPQKKTGGGTTGGQNRKGAKGVAGQKETSSVANAEQNNLQNSTANSKKHNIANVNNNISNDQSKTEKEKPHAKVSKASKQLHALLFSALVFFSYSLTSSSSTYIVVIVYTCDDCLQFCKLK